MRQLLKYSIIGLLCFGGFIVTAGADVGTMRTPPGGLNGSVQFNKGNQFAGDTYLTYSSATHQLNTPVLQTQTFIWNGTTYTITGSPSSGYLRHDGSGGLTFDSPSTTATSTGTALSVFDGTVQISSPTSSLNFNGSQFIVTLQGSTSAEVAVDPSSITVMGPLSVSSPLILIGGVFSVDKSSLTLLGPDPALGGALSGTIKNAVLGIVDISAKTNLAVNPPLILSGDTITIDKSSFTLLGPSIDANELPDDGYAGTYVNETGDTMTGQLTLAGSTLTVTGVDGIRSTYGISGGSLTARNLHNTLVAVDSDGVFISTFIVIPNAGNALLGVSSGSATDSVIVSSPTSNIIFDSNTFTVDLQGSTSAFVRVNPSSVTTFGPNVVRSGTAWQDVTAHISSMTVEGQLRVGSIISTGNATVADLTVTDDQTIGGGLTVNGGSGVTIPTLGGGECVQTSAGRRLSTTGAPCGGVVVQSSGVAFGSPVNIVTQDTMTFTFNNMTKILSVPSLSVSTVTASSATFTSLTVSSVTVSTITVRGKFIWGHPAPADQFTISGDGTNTGLKFWGGYHFFSDREGNYAKIMSSEVGVNGGDGNPYGDLSLWSSSIESANKLQRMINTRSGTGSNTLSSVVPEKITFGNGAQDGVYGYYKTQLEFSGYVSTGIIEYQTIANQFYSSSTWNFTQGISATTFTITNSLNAVAFNITPTSATANGSDGFLVTGPFTASGATSLTGTLTETSSATFRDTIVYIATATVSSMTVTNLTTTGIYTSSSVYVSSGSVGFDEIITVSSVSWITSNMQMCTLTKNETFTFTPPVHPASLILRINTGSGNFTVTWPTTVKWSGGTAPTITAAASKNDLVACYYAGDGNYYCAWTGNY